MENSQLEQRLSSIESRLLRLEGTVIRPIVPMPVINTIKIPQQPDTIPTIAEWATPSGEARSGNWLGIIAVFCFVLAAGFIVKLSIDSGWLTPIRQVGIVTLFGLSLIAAGLSLLQADRAYASLLPGAGVIVLYLTSFAAYNYYSLISFDVALGLTSLVSCICLWLYVRIRHDIYPLTAAIGAYVAPAILGLDADKAFSMYYFLLCSFAFAPVSIWVKSRLLTLVSAYLALLMTAGVGVDLERNELVAGLLAFHFLIFSTCTYLYTTENRKRLSDTEAWSFLPVLLLFYATEYYFIERFQHGLAPWISLVFAGFLIGLYLSAKKYFPDGLGSQSLILAFATIVCFHSVYLELLPDGFRPWLFVVIMLGAAFSPVSFSAQKSASAFRIPCYALFAVLANEYLTMAYHLLVWEEYSLSWLVVSFAAFASLWVMLARTDNKPDKETTYGHGLLGAAHGMAILAFYRLTIDTGSLAVSASWLFYGVSVIIFAFYRKDQAMAKSALFVLALAAGKALLYDAASAPTIVRILCLLLTGAVLYSCGFLMRKFDDWTNSAGVSK